MTCVAMARGGESEGSVAVVRVGKVWRGRVVGVWRAVGHWGVEGWEMGVGGWKIGELGLLFGLGVWGWRLGNRSWGQGVCEFGGGC